MEFIRESKHTTEEVPFLKDCYQSIDRKQVYFVEQAVVFPKGIMLFSTSFKATCWTGTNLQEKVAALIEEIRESEYSSTKSLYMQPDVDNPAKIQIAIESNDYNKARWSEAAPNKLIAAEVLTKKKAEDRVKSKS